jgi:integrase
VEDGGLPCIQISDEGEHQKVKTDVSLRTVPVHPDLLALGFLDWVKQARDEGQERLFPAAKADAKNGQGNWISKAFSRHLAEVGKNWPKAKRGFHSLRKTLSQELQGAGVVSELRAQLVGHELDDEHHVTYSRAFTAREKLDGLRGVSPGLSVLAYGISLNALLPLLKEPSPSKKPSKPRKQST